MHSGTTVWQAIVQHVLLHVVFFSYFDAYRQGCVMSAVAACACGAMLCGHYGNEISTVLDPVALGYFF